MKPANLHIVSLNHRNATIEQLGKLHVSEDRQQTFLANLKAHLGVQGIAYLTTCNRVEFVMVDESYFCMGRLQQLFQVFEPDAEDIKSFMANAMVLHGDEAVRHLLRVAAGLESMVLGEREILTQVRSAMERSREWGLAGDQLRIIERIVIETAKQVFTQTEIARNSVSVNALGWKAFLAKAMAPDSPILMVGAGQTNANIARYLEKQGHTDVRVINRTKEKARALAEPRGWKWGPMETLNAAIESKPAAIFLCTGSDVLVLDDAQEELLPAGNTFILDLSVPSGVCASMRSRTDVEVVDIAALKPIADQNTEGRRAALGDCQRIIDSAVIGLTQRLQQREVELALKELPALLAAVRNTALGEVFANELEELDGDTRNLVDRIVTYLEKKYLSVPMKLARKAVMEQLDKPGA